jgi:hypothetical protein
MGRNRHGEEVALTIRQPDGTLAQLPIWMTKDRAATMMVTEMPRLSLGCLRELRVELDAWQACCATIPVAKETSMPRPPPSHRYPDLFAPKEPATPIAASERTRLLPLVSALLAEALAVIAVAEAGDEDHA